jgi:hypothetical protein
VEHEHATLKMQIKKLKGGDEVLPPASQLHKALYTPNFLNCPEQGLKPAEGIGSCWSRLPGFRFFGKMC